MMAFRLRSLSSRSQVLATAISEGLTPSRWRKYGRCMRRVAQAFSTLLFFGAVTGFTISASAEDIYAEIRPSDGSTVKEHVRRARGARDAGRWAEAHAAYKAAFDAIDAASGAEQERAEIAGELGLCELALRHPRDAAEHLAWSLEQREALSRAQQERFSEGLRKAAKYVATLILAVDPPDAEVIVDGRSVGRTARTYKLFFEPGQHMVRARAPGREEVLHSLRAVAGAEHEISMQLPRTAVGLSRQVARPAPPPSSTSSTARTRAPGPWASWPGTLRITGIGLTTATASFGALFMIHADAADGDLDEHNRKLDELGVTSWACRDPSPPAACSELARLRQQRDQFAALGTAMMVASGVIGAATVASFFTELAFTRSEPASDRVAFAPVATPQQVGLVAYGAW
ncbi:PEGA domain-containing protein [Sorangium sp. So ce1182]|uniref:PEGA domain-containing protein n=1 Tax=Sorangium sp. So ce1182 TaxID=3133334 RepID=UPI003F62B640